VAKYFYSFDPVFSFITELELLSGKDFYPDELESIKGFLSKQTIYGYVLSIKDIVINVRKEKRLKLPDAIIVATAIFLDIPLISSDKSLRNISGLKLIYNQPDRL
jgi:predicted nucleic acid-binding protein